jgi:HK97 gp10 family phage protein
MASTLDTSGWKEGLAQLNGPLRESLARSMAVAGGQVLRDEAKLLAPVESGKLRDSIYLAFKDGKSNESQIVYSVTWNSRKAPHGHLLEFGHWQPYVVKKLPNGDWYTTNEKLPSPKFTAAKPFLRPAFDSAKGRATQAMIERGRQRLPELLAENDDGA